MTGGVSNRGIRAAVFFNTYREAEFVEPALDPDVDERVTGGGGGESVDMVPLPSGAEAAETGNSICEKEVAANRNNMKVVLGIIFMYCITTAPEGCLSFDDSSGKPRRALFCDSK